MAKEHERSIAIFESESGKIQLEIDLEHETVWATQQEIADAFECSAENVRQHISKIYSDGELDEIATSKIFLEVQKEGSRDVSRQINHYNLDLILSVGYRVSSKRATLFRQWATETLKRLIVEGYAFNPERIAASPEIQRRLHAALRQIRTSEKSMYSKVKDVFKLSASDYAEDSQATKSFYAMAQDKFHFAITGQTAAQIILERADAQMSNMGLTTMSSEGPTTQDVRVGKNYLTADELQGLENISEQFLLFAESKAFRGHKMMMEELATKLNVLLMANDYAVLYEYKAYLRDQADNHAKKQLSVYRAQLDAPRKKALNVGESDITDKSERNKKAVGRPPKPLPEIASSPEAAAKAVISLPPDHEWRYTKDEAENVQ